MKEDAHKYKVTMNCKLTPSRKWWVLDAGLLVLCGTERNRLWGTLRGNQICIIKKMCINILGFEIIVLIYNWFHSGGLVNAQCLKIKYSALKLIASTHVHSFSYADRLLVFGVHIPKITV